MLGHSAMLVSNLYLLLAKVSRTNRYTCATLRIRHTVTA